MHQSTTPSLSQTIWPRWASRQFLSLPIVQTLLPVTFGYPLSSEAVVMRKLRRWMRLWWRSLTCSPRGLQWGLPEVVGTAQGVHCSQRRLLRRGLEFHVCTINKMAPYEKILETYFMILSYIYIYIYIYVILICPYFAPRLLCPNMYTCKCLWIYNIIETFRLIYARITYAHSLLIKRDMLENKLICFCSLLFVLVSFFLHYKRLL